MRPKVVALAGGTGSAKLLRGLASLDCELSVIANVGDNSWMYGVYVCPDVDIAMYALAGVLDPRGWGVDGDSHEVLLQLARLGIDTWFNLGDRDMATCLLRTVRMASGDPLTKVTSYLCGRFGVKQPILPATDDPLETHVLTPQGDMHLQEFWVKNRGRPRVMDVSYRGASAARPTRQVEMALEGADRIVLCPANPVTSIGPTLAVSGMKRLVRRSRARKVALSPMVGSGPVSGPAGKLLSGCGIRTDSLGVAGMYRSLLDAIVIDKRDAALAGRITGLGVDCRLSDIIIRDRRDQWRLAKELLEA